MRLWLLLLVLLAVNATAQTGVNNSILRTALRTPEGYQQRLKDERYEGLYARDVSGEILEVASLTYGEVSYELNDRAKLKIECPLLRNYKTIGVAGSSFNLNKNYRFDMLLSPGKRKVIPISASIGPNLIYAKYLGIYGYLGEPENPTTYIPVKVNTVKSDLQLVLICNRTLESIRWKYICSASDNSTIYHDGPAPEKKSPLFMLGNPIVIPLHLATDMIPGSVVYIRLETKAVGDNTWVPKDIKILIP
ncbi:hypothetical protein SAMN05518672_101870 [Chitinophaga sp. CF118]|nr:hypothetical protein SAMN05518672_101870 [Chitinophaga sp. CF118]